MTQTEKDIAINEQCVIITDNENFLRNTDYQTIRETEGGEPMSAETKAARAEAREAINNAQAEIERLEAIEVEEPEPIEE